MSAARPRNSISQRFLLGLRNDRLGARARIDTSSPARLSSRADIERSARLVLQRPHVAKLVSAAICFWNWNQPSNSQP
jgi:hypothetical protein